MKSLRQEKILELIAQYEIETQDDLIRYLQADGFDVTQATISRDIRELKLTKVLTGHGSLGIDSMNLPKILGTVGGDDTVISVTKDPEYAKEATRKIHDLMRSF